jgi:hypothetical protein
MTIATTPLKPIALYTGPPLRSPDEVGDCEGRYQRQI